MEWAILGFRSPRLAAGVLVAVLLAGGDGGAASSGVSGTWVLAEIDGRPVDGGEPPFFAVDGLDVSGFDGCNRFSGRLDEPGRMTSTRRGCPDGILRLPLDLGNFRAHLETGLVAGNRLVFEARDSFPAAVFNRRK